MSAMNWVREHRRANVQLAEEADRIHKRLTRRASLVFGPDCKKCGGQTVQRWRKDDPERREKPFWGCRDYQRCADRAKAKAAAKT